MKKWALTLLVAGSFGTAAAQRTMTEGTIVYSITAAGGNIPNAADVYNGATLTTYFKGTQALQELKTNVLNQSVIYDGKNDTAVILKQSGDQKFIINLDAANWQHYNRRFEGINYTYIDSTRNIAGFACKKAVAQLSDGTELSVYYAPALLPSVKGYDYQFRTLPGLALAYEVQSGGMKVIYTATRVLFNPVPSFKFDVPKSGFRILDYKSS